VVNGLIERGFILLGLWEEDFGDSDAEPGTWEHFKAYAPPWLVIWARKTGVNASCAASTRRRNHPACWSA
jgi:hypothetical protein